MTKQVPMEDSAESSGKRHSFTFNLVGECKDPKTKEEVVVYPFLNDYNEKDFLMVSVVMKYQPWGVKHGDGMRAWSEFFKELQLTPDRTGFFLFADSKLTTIKNRITNMLKLEEKWYEKNGVERILQVQKDGTLMIVEHEQEPDDFYENNDGRNYARKIQALCIQMMESNHRAKNKKGPSTDFVESEEDVANITSATTCGALAWKPKALASVAKKQKTAPAHDPCDGIAKMPAKKTPPLRSNEIEHQLTLLRDDKKYKYDLNLKKMEIAKSKEEKEKAAEETKKIRYQLKLEKMKQETLRLENAKHGSN